MLWPYKFNFFIFFQTFIDNLFASGSFDKTIKIWDINTKKCVQTLEGHASNVICLLLHSSGLLISSSGDRNVKVWKNQ